jgi:lipopolysaccharide transport system permease protein
VETISDADTHLSRALPTTGTADDYVVRIKPAKGWPGLGLGELWRYRRICLVLARRSLMIRYRQTLLGFAWTVAQPTILMIIFTVFFGMLGKLPSQGVEWPVFYFLGILPWHICSKIVSEGSASVVANGALLNRVYFPRAYFPMAVSIASLVDFLFGLVPLALLLLIYSVPITVNILFVPVFVLLAVITSLGVSFWLSSLNASYRDIQQLLPAIVQAWFFLTPIIYPIDIVPPQYQQLYALNPIVTVVGGFRWAFAHTPAPGIEILAVSFGTALVLLFTGYIFFRHREPTFADVV